jgi:hypothetical protein
MRGSIPMLAILLAGLLLRLGPIGQNRALEDEALYSFWGLQIATASDQMLDREPVDKPPFYPYILALSFTLFGPVQRQVPSGDSAPEQDRPIVGAPLACKTTACRIEIRRLETASRLPSLFASVASIALVYALGSRLYGGTLVGLLAALLYALSPFAILFASTAFVDPWLTVWALGALLAASAGRIGLAGVLVGLAAATKQQGLLFLPLVVTFGVLSDRQWRRPSGPRPSNKPLSPWPRRRWIRWLLFVLGLAAVLGGVIAWDQARESPGFFQQSVVSYGGFRFASLSDLGHRALSWLRLIGYLWVSPWLNGLLLGALLAWATFAVLRTIQHHWSGRSVGAGLSASPTGQDSGAASVALFLFAAAFLILHWLLDLQVWDRYLLVLLPLLSVLAARAVVAVGRALPAGRWRAAYASCLAVALMAALPGPLLGAMHSQIPVGGDHGAYDGIDDLSAYIRDHLPPGSVLYDHWLGYHYRFYLYGAALHIHWYPDLTDLSQDAQAYVREPRYIAFPSWRDSSSAVASMTRAGIALAPVYETHRRDGSTSFRLYRLVGP